MADGMCCGLLPGLLSTPKKIKTNITVLLCPVLPRGVSFGGGKGSHCGGTGGAVL